MKRAQKLYLSLGLLVSTHLQSNNETINNLEINTIEEAQLPSVQIEIVAIEETQEISIEEKIDQELYEVFRLFFDEHDKTSFSKIVGQVINLLKQKRATLHDAEMVKCDEIIKLLEENKFNYFFPTWAKILINPDLLNLMSPQTRSYIENVSNMVKIQSLIRRLKNH